MRIDARQRLRRLLFLFAFTSLTHAPRSAVADVDDGCLGSDQSPEPGNGCFCATRKSECESNMDSVRKYGKTLDPGGTAPALDPGKRGDRTLTDVTCRADLSPPNYCFRYRTSERLKLADSSWLKNRPEMKGVTVTCFNKQENCDLAIAHVRRFGVLEEPALLLDPTFKGVFHSKHAAPQEVKLVDETCSTKLSSDAAYCFRVRMKDEPSGATATPSQDPPKP